MLSISLPDIVGGYGDCRVVRRIEKEERLPSSLPLLRRPIPRIIPKIREPRDYDVFFSNVNFIENFIEIHLLDNLFLVEKNHLDSYIIAYMPRERRIKGKPPCNQLMVVST
jgi:hypothetical protein